MFQEKFSDVVNWLKANATKAENSTPGAGAGASFAGKKLLPEVTNKENKIFGEKSGSPPVSTTTTTTTSFASPWSPGIFSNSQNQNQNLFTFGGRSLLTFLKYTQYVFFSIVELTLKWVAFVVPHAHHSTCKLWL